MSCEQRYTYCGRMHLVRAILPFPEEERPGRPYSLPWVTEALIAAAERLICAQYSTVHVGMAKLT